MSDDVKPAMTAEEWAKGYVTIAEVSRRPHAIAALALHCQPFGFTREDAALVRRIADECDGTLADADDERIFADQVRMTMGDVRRLFSLAARIAALLPPEEPR